MNRATKDRLTNLRKRITKKRESFVERRIYKRSVILTQSTTLCFWSPTYGEFLGRRELPVNDFVRGRTNICQISPAQICTGDAHGRLFFLNLLQNLDQDRIVTKAHHNEVQSVASSFEANRNHVDPYVLSAHRKVKLWRFRRKKKSEFLTKKYERILSICVCSRDCKKFASSSRSLRIRYYDITKQKPIFTVQDHASEDTIFHPHHCIKSDLQSFQVPILFSSSVDTIKIYTPNQKSHVQEIRFYVHFLQSFCYFPEKYMIIAGDTDGTIYCSDFRKPVSRSSNPKSSDNFLWTVANAHSQSVLNVIPNTCVFDNKGYSFVSGSASGSMSIRNVDDGRMMVKFKENRKKSNPVNGMMVYRYPRSQREMLEMRGYKFGGEKLKDELEWVEMDVVVIKMKNKVIRMFRFLE